VTDVVSISSSAPPAVHAGRMPPSAMMLAVLLHVLVALALWTIAMHPPHLPPPETPIDVTFEKPKPPTPPPVPPKQAPQQKAQPAPPPKLGLAPPAAITADKPSQAPSRAKETQQALAPHPPSLEQAVPPPQSQTPAPPAIEPSESERPAPSQQAHVSSVPTPAPPPPARQTQQPPIRPSPLTQSPRQQPPALASREAPSPSPFVNPADTYARARVADNYLWQVVGKLAGYRYQANVRATEGTTVIRIDIARNGRLIDVAVVRSSGVPAFDQGVLAGVRAGSPYAPLPPEIHGEHASFTLPLVSVRER